MAAAGGKSEEMLQARMNVGKRHSSQGGDVVWSILRRRTRNPARQCSRIVARQTRATMAVQRAAGDAGGEG